MKKMIINAAASEEIRVAITMFQARGIQRRSAAPRIANAGRSVTCLARAVKNALAFQRGRWIVGERVDDRIRHGRLLREKDTGGHCRNSTCGKFDSVVHSERNYNPWPERLRP